MPLAGDTNFFSEDPLEIVWGTALGTCCVSGQVLGTHQGMLQGQREAPIEYAWFCLEHLGVLYPGSQVLEEGGRCTWAVKRRCSKQLGLNW